MVGFPGYFLIVMEFIQWSKDNDVPVGPGRGSGAGSLVAYALDITTPILTHLNTTYCSNVSWTQNVYLCPISISISAWINVTKLLTT